MKRLFCIIGSLLVCTSSVFAWNANSFLADGSAEYQPYVSDELLEDPMGEPMMVSTFSMRATESGSASAEVHEVDWTQGSWDFFTDKRKDQLFGMYTYNYIYVSPDLTYEFPGIEYFDVPIYKSESSVYHSWRTASTLLTIPSIADSVEYVSMANGRLTLPVNLDYLPANSNAFEFSLNLSNCFVRGYHNGAVKETIYPTTLDVYLNGSKVKSYGFSDTGSLDVSGEIVSINSGIQDAYFVITVPQISLYDDVVISPTATHYYIWWSYFSLNNSISYSFLDLRDTIINDFHNQQAGDALDEHSAIESQWSGSMMDNFNALDIGSFAFPGGLIAALALLTGIFNDLWNGMGEYKVLYVFPLTLGVVLLLIGRISKFSGQRSSARSGKGDDSA